MALSDNLQGWWCPSLDTAGNGTTTLTDLSGNGNNGTLTNMDAATDWVADTDSGGVRALDFDGDNDFIEIGTIATSNNLQLASGAMALSLWIKPDLAGDSFQRLVDRSNGGNGANGFALYLDNASWYPSLAINGNITQYKADVAPVSGVWNHIVVVKVDGSDARFWVNGVETGLSLKPPSDLTIPFVETNMRIATWNHSTAREYNGRIDSVAAFTAALTGDDVAQLYNGGRSLKLVDLSTGLQGWWCPSLDTAGNGTTTLTDLSGNGNHGTLTNMEAATDWVADTDNGGVRALDFNGIDEFVQIPLLVSGVTNFTVHWWQKLDVTSGTPTMVSFINPYWHVPYNSNRAFYNSRPSLRPLITINTGEWYSVAIVENGTNGKLYIDGVLAATFTGGYAGDINSDTLFLGAQRNGSGYANGCIDAVAVYDRALTSDEITQRYNGGRSLNLLASGGSGNIAHVLASMQQQQESVVVL